MLFDVRCRSREASLCIDVHLIDADNINIVDTDKSKHQSQVTADKVYGATQWRANNGEFLAAVARRGQRIVSGPLALLQDLIERGELVQILTGFSRQVTGMYAVYPPGRLVSQRVRVFSDALYAHFRERSI